MINSVKKTNKKGQYKEKQRALSKIRPNYSMNTINLGVLPRSLNENVS